MQKTCSEGSRLLTAHPCHHVATAKRESECKIAKCWNGSKCHDAPKEEHRHCPAHQVGKVSWPEGLTHYSCPVSNHCRCDTTIVSPKQQQQQCRSAEAQSNLPFYIIKLPRAPPHQDASHHTDGPHQNKKECTQERGT